MCVCGKRRCYNEWQAAHGKAGNRVQKSVYCENGKIHLDANNGRMPGARQTPS